MKPYCYVLLTAALCVAWASPSPSSQAPPLKLFAPEGTRNLALGKPVTASDKDPIIGEPALICDGNKEAVDGNFVEFVPGVQFVQIDLGEPCEISAILLWHYHAQPRAYIDVVVRVAEDPDFIKGVRTLFNNDFDGSAKLGVGKDSEYIESNWGLRIDAKGVRARYVRLYSNGNTVNALNHYTEVEVHGRPLSEIAPGRAPSEDLVPLKIVLPPPVFKGTPRNFRFSRGKESQKYYSRPPQNTPQPRRRPSPPPPPPVAQPRAYRPAPTPLPARQHSPSSYSPNRYAQKMPGNEVYAQVSENTFLNTRGAPLSTFSIDVDTASYSNMRRFITRNQLPPKESIRIEEWVNYFPYDYPAPRGHAPFSVNVEINDCPWNDAHRLARVGLRGRDIDWSDRPPSNLVFLLDVSGSMSAQNKLPLVKRAMKMLLERLGENDRVAIVVYAGSSGLALSSTSCDNDAAIMLALDRLRANGSTNGAGGIQLAYRVAIENFIEGGTNRVILATDGDFNVGVTNRQALIELAQRQARSGVYLSILGFGMGNLKDATLEQLADKGNGNYAYIDTASEARKALVEQIAGTLITIAKDVKIQVEFNPEKVESYRLIGYENRILRAEDFNDDQKDAGEIGAGLRVTALYELVPPGAEARRPGVDRLKYQPTVAPKTRVKFETLTVKVRYKRPDEEKSRLIKVPVNECRKRSLDAASTDFRFAAAVASFGMALRNSPNRGDATISSALQMARRNLGDDPGGYRSEFIQLARKALALGGM